MEGKRSRTREVNGGAVRSTWIVKSVENMTEMVKEVTKLQEQNVSKINE